MRLPSQVGFHRVDKLIDQFLLYLATERGLSTNYQLSTRRSLETFAQWLTGSENITRLDAVEPGHFTEFLAWRKRSGLAATSIKLEAIALRIFFRFLHARNTLASNPAENPQPRRGRAPPGQRRRNRTPRPP
jgi:integrase/recombinase XerD